MRVGFIGAGLMGHGACRHLLKAGHDVTVVAHRNREPVDDLVSRGAVEAATVAELTRDSDLVFLCLPDAPTVERVVGGPAGDGLMSQVRAGQIIVDMTTSLPDLTRRLHAEFAARNVSFIDGPMTRTPKEAEEGRLNLMLGGPADVVGKVMPVVESFCENVWHVGEAGAAHALKLVNNFLAVCNLASVLEAAVAAERFGIDQAKLLEIASAGGADSAVLRKVMPYPIEGDASGFQAHVSTALKDISYYNQMADESQLFSVMSKSAQQFFQLACTRGHGEELIPRYYDALKSLGSAPED